MKIKKINKVNLRPVNLRRRIGSRLAAIQFLFETKNKFSNNEDLKKFALFFEQNFSLDLKIQKIDFVFFKNLVLGVNEKIVFIDKFISDNLKEEWKIDRVSFHELSVLRVAIYELISIKKVPFKSIISEYIDIGDSLNSDVSFINALLDKASKKFRQNN